MHGSNNDEVRRHNLSAILRLVHRDGPQSRAQLTRRSGLNRSTVGVLLGELAELGLLAEGAPDAAGQVGRPSPVVSVGRGIVAFAVNPEVDAITMALVGLGGTVHRRIRHATAHAPSPSEAVCIAAEAIAGLRGELDPSVRVAGVGLAVPGQVSSADGVVRLAPHLGWQDVPLAELLAEATGYPCFAANDAGLGAVAEWRFGAGRGCDTLIYLNGGASGIGGGVIAGGAPFGGVGGFAGEFGHIRVSASAARDSAGLPGTLEAEVTAAALLEVLGLTPADGERLEPALLAAIAAVDGAAGGAADAVRREVHRQLDHLGTALGAAVNILNPELIVLGGFLASLHAADSGRLDGAMRRAALAAPGAGVGVVRAALGANLLMVGAAELAFAAVLDDPVGHSAGYPAGHRPVAGIR